MKRNVNGLWDTECNRDVGCIITNGCCFVQIIPSIVVNVDAVVVIALRNGAMTETCVLIGADFSDVIFSKVNINKFNGEVG